MSCFSNPVLVALQNWHVIKIRQCRQHGSGATKIINQTWGHNAKIVLKQSKYVCEDKQCLTVKVLLIQASTILAKITLLGHFLPEHKVRI